MVEVRGKKYKVLEIIKKSQFPQQDLYVCMSEYGYRECFQRYDVDNKYVDARTKGIFAWTDEEKQQIREKILKGETLTQISREFCSPIRSQQAIIAIAYKIKKELGL